MNAAIKRAQQTFPEFVKELELESRRIIPALDAAVVKAFFFDPDTPERGEHMFVDDIRVEGQTIHGVVSGTPNSVTSVSEGQTVSFPASGARNGSTATKVPGRGGPSLDVIARRW